MNKVVSPADRTYIIFNEELVPEIDESIFGERSLSITGTNVGKVRENVLGRGSVYFFQYNGLELALRHCHRGGLIRHFVDDQYYFSSLERTRIWREFHLLQTLYELKLPVPKAVAARCVKASPFSYRGDLVTQTVLDTQTLAEVLSQRDLEKGPWAELGRLIARFHRCGVYHSDLNANNILLTGDGEFYLMDFDRCEIRSDSSGQRWKQRNLARLLRSLRKISGRSTVFHFAPDRWQVLIDAYETAATVSPSMCG